MNEWDGEKNMKYIDDTRQTAPTPTHNQCGIFRLIIFRACEGYLAKMRIKSIVSACLRERKKGGLCCYRLFLHLLVPLRVQDRYFPCLLENPHKNYVCLLFAQVYRKNKKCSGKGNSLIINV